MRNAARTKRLARTPALTVAVYVWLCGLNAGVAAECMPEPQGEGRVAAVIDARTIRLHDGREIRLTGIAPTAPLDTGAGVMASLARLVDANVTLHGDSDEPDRYGRQRALVYPEGSETSVQSALLLAGEALYDAGIAEPGCAAELRASESMARQANKGLWGTPGVIKSAERSGDILAAIGQFAVIEGRVRSVRQAGAVVYLNFGRRWTQDFAVTISARSLALFEAAGLAPKSLDNQRIRVRGFIEQRGGPRIEAVRAEQIEISAARADSRDSEQRR